jgi:tRNA pseudouridine13 synthase
VSDTQPGAFPGEWRIAALDPPRAWGTPPLSGRLRVTPEDFRVEERLGFEPDGGAAHLLLSVEKREANTLYVARALARLGGLRAADVGFAGLKDRRAVAVQWFSVPARRPPADWLACAGEGFRVLEARPHSRKLRRGALAGNRFRIVLRDLAGDVAALGRRLGQIASGGVPNYFGPQRFGRHGANLAGVADWLAGGALPRDRAQRSFVISAARSLAFNQVLAARVADGSWNRLLPGEVVNLAGCGSVFAAAEVDEALAARCADLDVHPTGPLPGRDGVAPSGPAGRAEASAIATCGALVDALAAAGVDAARRPLRVAIESLDWTLDDAGLELRFGLQRGSFATAVLRELAAIDVADLPAGDD